MKGEIISKYEARVKAINSLVCVGLDSDMTKIPPKFQKDTFPQFAFNKWIIDKTHEFAAAYKPNSAFYEARGEQGIKELKMTMEYLMTHHPSIVTILDAKRADIGNTNEGYVRAIFDWLGFDAVTLHPYLGKEALMPFLDRIDKACIILCRTSNPGAGEFQDLRIDGHPLWHHVATKVRDEWNTHNNCMLVVGATYPTEMKTIRALVGDMTFLVPGIGAQGGSIEETVMAGQNDEGMGMIMNSARGIIFDTNPKKAAQILRDEINEYRKKS